MENNEVTYKLFLEAFSSCYNNRSVLDASLDGDENDWVKFISETLSNADHLNSTILKDLRPYYEALSDNKRNNEKLPKEKLSELFYVCIDLNYGKRAWVEELAKGSKNSQESSGDDVTSENYDSAERNIRTTDRNSQGKAGSAKASKKTKKSDKRNTPKVKKSLGEKLKSLWFCFCGAIIILVNIICSPTADILVSLFTPTIEKVFGLEGVMAYSVFAEWLIKIPLGILLAGLLQLVFCIVHLCVVKIAGKRDGETLDATLSEFVIGFPSWWRIFAYLFSSIYMIGRIRSHRVSRLREISKEDFQHTAEEILKKLSVDDLEKKKEYKRQVNSKVKRDKVKRDDATDNKEKDNKEKFLYQCFNRKLLLNWFDKFAFLINDDDNAKRSKVAAILYKVVAAILYLSVKKVEFDIDDEKLGKVERYIKSNFIRYDKKCLKKWSSAEKLSKTSWKELEDEIEKVDKIKINDIKLTDNLANNLYDHDPATPADWFFGYAVLCNNTNKRILLNDVNKCRKEKEISPFEIFMESNGDGTFNICCVILDWNYNEASGLHKASGLSEYTLGLREYKSSEELQVYKEVVLISKRAWEDDQKLNISSNGSNGKLEITRDIYKVNGGKILLNVTGLNSDSTYKAESFSNKFSAEFELIFNNEKSYCIQLIAFKKVKIYDKEEKQGEKCKYFKCERASDDKKDKPLKERIMRCPYCGRSLTFPRKRLEKNCLYCDGTEVEKELRTNNEKGIIYCKNNKLFGADGDLVLESDSGIIRAIKDINNKENDGKKNKNYLKTAKNYIDGNSAIVCFLGESKCGKSTLISRLFGIERNGSSIEAQPPQFNVLRQLLSNGFKDEGNITFFAPPLSGSQVDDFFIFKRIVGLSTQDCDTSYKWEGVNITNVNVPTIPGFSDYAIELYGKDTKATTSSDYVVDYLSYMPFMLKMKDSYLTFYDVPGGAVVGDQKAIKLDPEVGNSLQTHTHPLFHADVIVVMVDSSNYNSDGKLDKTLSALNTVIDAEGEKEKKVAIAIVLSKFDQVYDRFENSCVQTSIPNIGSKVRYIGSELQKYIDRCSDVLEGQYNREDKSNNIEAIKKLRDKGCIVKYFAVSSIGRGSSVGGKADNTTHLYNVKAVGVESLLIWIAYQVGVIE